MALQTYIINISSSLSIQYEESNELPSIILYITWKRFLVDWFSTINCKISQVCASFSNNVENESP